MDPLRNSVPHISAVGVEVHAARPLERFKGADRGEQFHSVVGGLRLTARQLHFARAEAKQSRPTARTRVPAASSIGEDVDFGKLRHAGSGDEFARQFEDHAFGLVLRDLLFDVKALCQCIKHFPHEQFGRRRAGGQSQRPW